MDMCSSLWRIQFLSLPSRTGYVQVHYRERPIQQPIREQVEINAVMARDRPNQLFDIATEVRAIKAPSLMVNSVNWSS